MTRPVVTFSIDGLKELDEALAELPRATGKNVAKRTLIKAAQPIADEWERLAPVRKGTYKRSISISQKLSRRQRSMHKKESTVEVFVGAGSLPQAHMSEFGTARQAPRPAARPAWDGNKHRSLEIIRNTLAEEIEKARARLAKKAARLAAKS